MSRVLSPRVGVGQDALVPFAVLAACWVPIAAVGLVWLCGHAASWAVGDGFTGPPFDVAFGRRVLAGDLGAVWPTVPSTLLWTFLTAALLAVAAVLASVAVVARRRAAAAGPLALLAPAGDLGGLTGPAALERATRLRPLTADRHAGPADVGVPLGLLGRPGRRERQVCASWEDVILAVMAPRAGKTTSLAVPALLEAPGAAVATSNKADLWEATRLPCAARGRVWLFDPQGITRQAQGWWWNPLAGVRTVEDSHRLASHFLQEVRGGRQERDFWTSAAHDLLTGLLLAAALDGRTLVEVYEWLNDPGLTTPAQMLRQHGQPAAAASLLGRQNGAPETRDGVYETARTAAQCLRDPRIMRWVTPTDLPVFDAAALPSSRDTLHLLSKDGAGGAAPLVAALADRVVRDAVRQAERSTGGRLDPPMVVVLDEAANVCRIADLPDLYSHLGSRGVVPMTILQSYRQGTRVWGEEGMSTLWSAATVKLLGAGLDDARLVEDVSKLVGDHDVPVRSVNRGDRRSDTVSLRRQRILPPEDLRALPKGTALLLATGCRAALLRLRPWYDSEHRDTVTESLTARGRGDPRV